MSKQIRFPLILNMGVFFRGNTTDVVILGHHIIGDGLGYLNLLKDLLLALDGRSPKNAATFPDLLSACRKNNVTVNEAISAAFIAALKIESAFFSIYGNYENPASGMLGEILGERTSGKGIGISNLGRQSTEA